MGNIIIRNATINDINEVAQLHVNSWHETYAGIISQNYLDNMKNNLPRRIERMKNEFNLRTMIVAEIDNEIVGFSEFVFSNEFSKDLDIDCELCGLYIKNGYKHLGLGSKMFEYVVNLFKAQEKKSMGIWCVKENEPAISFYKKKGGIVAKEKKFTIDNQEYSEVAFIYDLYVKEKIKGKK